MAKLGVKESNIVNRGKRLKSKREIADYEIVIKNGGVSVSNISSWAKLGLFEAKSIVVAIDDLK